MAAIHIARQRFSLDEETYRDLLIRLTGHRSAGELDAAGRRKVLDYFNRAGFGRPAANPLEPIGSIVRRGLQGRPRPLHGKALALWHSLAHLGEVTDPSDAALDAFVRRQTGVDAARFASAPQINRVIEALKDWLHDPARGGCARPTQRRLAEINGWRQAAGLEAEGEGYAAKVMLIEALWQRLAAAGAFATGDHACLGTWLARRFGCAAPWFLSPADADSAAAALGRWLAEARQAS